jgi:hypothetical protein
VHGAEFEYCGFVVRVQLDRPLQAKALSVYSELDDGTYFELSKDIVDHLGGVGARSEAQ